MTPSSALLVVGAAVTGVAVRAAGPNRSRYAPALALLGLLLVQVTALVQTSVTVSANLRAGRLSEIYLLALIAVTVLGILAGTVVLLLIASASRAGAVAGIAVSAVALASWLGALISPIGSLPGDGDATMLGLLRWVPAVLVGASIAWAGIGSIGRVAAGIWALVVLWLGPVLLTATASAAGSRVLARDPRDMATYAAKVIQSASTSPEVVAPPLLLALVIAGGGLAARNRWPVPRTG